MRTTAFSKTYGTKRVLDLPELEIAPGAVTAVVGANGSGKSTMAKILAGLEPADGGGKPLSGIRVGYLPQKPFAFRMTVEQNIALNGADAKQREAMMEALGLTPLRRSRAKKLSGGETAKMALARILAGSYDLLILDEPTAAMDMESTLAAEKLIVDYREKTGCAVLLITHALAQAERIADRLWYLHRGALCEQGETKAVLAVPKQPETKAFLEFYGK